MLGPRRANYTGVVILYRDQGVVLRTIKLGETDRIVTILTQGHGKVRAVAKGVRKPREPLRRPARAHEPRRAPVLPGPRELDVVTQVETIDANRALREHYGCLTHAVSMLEATDQVAQEREPNPALYRMLVGALRTLADDPTPLVSAAFFWKLLSLEGFHPMLDACARCGDEDGPFAAFDLDEGGVLCDDVRPLRRSADRRPTTLALLRRILGGELRRALAEPPGRATTDEVERLGARRARAPPRAPPAQRRLL